VIRRLAQFLLIGGSAFLVDAGSLWVLWRGLGLDPLLGRAVSISAALVYTFLLNRAFTFADRKAGLSAFPSYVAASLLAIGLNMLVYGLTLRLLPTLSAAPLIGVACGTLAGMSLNFTLYNWAVFARR